MSGNPPELDVLLDRCLQWDEDSWATLFRNFDERVLRWLAKRLYRATEAELDELRQKVFAKLARSLTKYQRSTPFTSWLYQMTDRIAIDHLRTTTNPSNCPPGGIQSLAQPDEEGAQLDISDAQQSPAESTVQAEEHQLLHRAIEELEQEDPRAAKLIRAHYFGGLTYAEIGSLLEMQAMTVGTALNRARPRLKTIYDSIAAGNRTSPPANSLKMN
jgi:RNA polymerase sigma factor (sigma-70 family)